MIWNYSPTEILSSDHCSFQQEYIFPVTLSCTDQRTTEVAVRKRNNVIHSYTVQPVTSADRWLLKKFYPMIRKKHYTHINRTEFNMSDRQLFINIHSVIHNQLSASEFRNLIKDGFIKAKIIEETFAEIKKPNYVCFRFHDLHCSNEPCNEHTCCHHFTENIHLHLWNKSLRAYCIWDFEYLSKHFDWC